MLFNSIIAASILAFTASALPQGTQPASPAPTALPTPAPLSLTAQLTLADTAVDRFALLPKDSSFLFKFVDNIKPGGKGGEIVAANRKTFPALVGTGSGMAVGFLDACGFNTPHVHPRATELQIVVDGKIIVEMMPENGVNGADGKRRTIRNEVPKFGMTPFYQGSVHTQYNPECKPATFVASFNSEDFGTGQIPEELFALSSDIVTASFGEAISGKDVDKFKGSIPASVALGVKECVMRCYNADGTLKDPKGNNNPAL